MTILRFWAPVTPRQQGSKWRRTVAMAALAAKQEIRDEWPYLGPACVEMIFFTQRPLTLITKPDIDKLSRAVLDSLVIAGILKDESQVCRLSAWKIDVTQRALQGVAVDVLKATNDLKA